MTNVDLDRNLAQKESCDNRENDMDWFNSSLDRCERGIMNIGENLLKDSNKKEGSTEMFSQLLDSLSANPQVNNTRLNALKSEIGTKTEIHA